MIIVKTPKTKVSKNKVYKYSLITEFKPDNLKLDNGSIILTHSQRLELANKKIEECNRRLERLRLISRAIECSFNRNAKQELPQLNQIKINRTKGYYFSSVDSQNGIFIH